VHRAEPEIKTGRGLLGGLVLAVVVLVAACSAPEPAPPSPSAPWSPAPSELDAFEDRIFGVSEPGEQDPRPRAAEEGVADCMTDAGFDYHPQVLETRFSYSTPAVMTREHAARSGYGETIEPARGVPPARWAPQGDVPGERANIEYRESLAPEDLDEYWVALLGGESTEGANGGPGCHGLVMAEVYADVVVPEEFRAAQTALHQVGRAIEADPRVTGRVDRWRACMAGAGYPGLEARTDPVLRVSERADALALPAGGPFEEITELHASELAEVQDFERALALTDASCLEEVGFYEVWDEVRTELRDRIALEHRGELEDWAGWAEEHREDWQ